MIKTKPATEYALLGTMMRSPKHGYEILRFLDTTLGATWHVSTSQLYALLRKLESRGLLKSDIQTQETRPSKRIFSLTSKGRQAFLEWLHSPADHVRDIRIEFLAKLFFFRHLSLEGSDRLIEAQIRVLRGIEEKIEETLGKEEDTYQRLVLGFKATTLKAWLQWLILEASPFAGESSGPPKDD